MRGLDPHGIEFGHGRKGKASKRDVRLSILAKPGDEVLSNALLLLCLKECSVEASSIKE